MSDIQWYSIVSKYDGICKECNERYDVGDDILWARGKGAKHKECKVSSLDDFGITVIDENSDTPKIWKDPKKYTYKELLDINNCQCCGNSITKEAYLDDDRKVCVNCFG